MSSLRKDGTMLALEDVLPLLHEAKLAGPISVDAINRAQATLGVELPSDYRAFLAAAGAALGNGYEIAGVFDTDKGGEAPLWSDVVVLNRQIRRLHQAQIPPAYVAISTDGSDSTFYIDTGRRDASGRSPIVVVGPGREDDQVVADDFFEFAAMLCKGETLFRAKSGSP